MLLLLQNIYFCQFIQYFANIKGVQSYKVSPLDGVITLQVPVICPLQNLLTC